MKKYLILSLFLFGFDGCPQDMEEDVKRAEKEVNELRIQIMEDIASERYESACNKRNKVVEIGQSLCRKYKDSQCGTIMNKGTLDCSKYENIPINLE